MVVPPGRSAHWWIVALVEDHALVQLWACTGEPVERLESDNRELIGDSPCVVTISAATFASLAHDVQGQNPALRLLGVGLRFQGRFHRDMVRGLSAEVWER